jgi:hypothetical protein
VYASSTSGYEDSSGPHTKTSLGPTVSVEQTKTFDFIVNLKAAEQIGLTIPPNVLVRADGVIR